MKHPQYYYILAFATTTDAMQAEKYAINKIKATIMPVPREISSGCGLALRFLDEDFERILDFCQNVPFCGNLYKMSTERINGYHPVEPVFSIPT